VFATRSFSRNNYPVVEDAIGPFADSLGPDRRVLLIFLAVGLCAAATMAAAKPGLNDVGISDAVEDQVLIDTGAPAYAIDVETRKGIVALGGTVANILSGERAVAITETVKV
jgi:hypothetical protein